jgi:predicted dehydrogenase
MPDRSRREFVIRSAALAAAPLVGGMSLAQTPPRKLGVALVGLGSLSEKQIAPSLQKTRLCRLAAIVTGTPAKAAAWQAKYGLPDSAVYAYEDMARMADNPDIDIVYVVTPNALHLPHATAAAAAGKHVYCEKPLEVTTERAQAIVDACDKAAVRLGVAYRLQFEPHHLECLRLVRERVLGELRLIDCSFGFNIGDPTQWRLRRDLAGGGPLLDVGVYCLQTARLLTGEDPIWISAVETKTDAVKFREVEESVAWTMKFPGGVVSNSFCTYGAQGFQGFRAGATRGWFAMEPAYYYSGNQGVRSDGQPLRYEVDDQFATQLDDFADCILTGRATRVPGEMGVSDVRYLMAVYESIRTGRPVELA